jgi:hypothetical protein
MPEEEKIIPANVSYENTGQLIQIGRRRTEVKPRF